MDNCDEPLDVFERANDAGNHVTDRKADLQAVNEAVADMEAGDTGKRLVEVADEIRARHGWPKD